ncbi:hypothetical protein ABIB25_000462 [Nakamurella sp. UYEF19]|uniref:hypothetical protein n=1 Tax=Nakamurella sp. UYEF19 TaxID=1756392 RepID=UPI003391FEDE
MRLPPAVRILEVLAALLSAGLVVLGLALAVLVVAAPALVSGTGVAGAGGPAGNLLVTDGPRLDRVLVQLIVGVLGEFLHLKRSRLPERSRPAVAVVVILVSFAALWWGWWR